MDYEYNRCALEILGKGEFYGAQGIMRKNVHDFPSHETFQNYGEFLRTEGLQLSSDRHRRAHFLSLAYLHKAEQLGTTRHNLVSLATAYFERQDFISAEKYFRCATAIHSSSVTHNNLGVVLFQMGEPLAASECFWKAYNICGDDSDMESISAAIVFSKLKYSKKGAHKSLSKLRLNVYDEFIATFLCGDTENAARQIPALFEMFYVPPEVMAMILQCEIDIDRIERAKEHLDNQLIKLSGYEYNTKPEENQIHRAFNSSVWRNRLIESYRYIPQLIQSCNYFDCPLHQKVIVCD
jgi:tetratricopeptide (TPR) repeat protein